MESLITKTALIGGTTTVDVTYAIPVTDSPLRIGPNVVHCMALVGKNLDYLCRNKRKLVDGLCGRHNRINESKGGSFTINHS